MKQAMHTSTRMGVSSGPACSHAARRGVSVRWAVLPCVSGAPQSAQTASAGGVYSSLMALLLRAATGVDDSERIANGGHVLGGGHAQG